MGMDVDDILARIKANDKTHIPLSPLNVAKVIVQLPEDVQAKCFYASKEVKPLNEAEALAALIKLPNWMEKIDGKDPNDLGLETLRKVVKNNRDAIKDWLVKNNLWSRTDVIRPKSVPGNYSPTKFWEALDIITDINLTDPE